MMIANTKEKNGQYDGLTYHALRSGLGLISGSCALLIHLRRLNVKFAWFRALRALPTVKWAGKQSTHPPVPQPFHKYRAVKQFVPVSYLRRAETMEPMRLAFRRSLFIVLLYMYIHRDVKKKQKPLCSMIVSRIPLTLSQIEWIYMPWDKVVIRIIFRGRKLFVYLIRESSAILFYNILYGSVKKTFGFY